MSRAFSKAHTLAQPIHCLKDRMMMMGARYMRRSYPFTLISVPFVFWRFCLHCNVMLLLWACAHIVCVIKRYACSEIESHCHDGCTPLA